MDAAHLASLIRVQAVAPSRRGVARAVAGSTLAAALSSLVGLNGTVAKKKHKKKGKKCPKVDRCPHRFCCECSDNSCHLIEANGTAGSACATFCQSLGLGLTGWADALAGTLATMCSDIEQCVAVNCPVV